MMIMRWNWCWRGWKRGATCGNYLNKVTISYSISMIIFNFLGTWLLWGGTSVDVGGREAPVFRFRRKPISVTHLVIQFTRFKIIFSFYFVSFIFIIFYYKEANEPCPIPSFSNVSKLHHRQLVKMVEKWEAKISATPCHPIHKSQNCCLENNIFITFCQNIRM